MLEADLHVHSLFSGCGLHSFLELLGRGRQAGLKAMAITDHGLAVGGGRLNSVFFERFTSPFPDITLYKGIELNVLGDRGRVDLPWEYLPCVDILLLGLHHNLPAHQTREFYTDLTMAAMEHHPFIDIITHPNDPAYPLDYRLVAKKAKGLGMALELNNSKLLYNRSTVESAVELIDACLEVGCPMAVNSDTHALLELGGDESVRPLLEKAGFPESLIVNRDAGAAAAFIDGRRGVKLLAAEKRKAEKELAPRPATAPSP